MDVTLKEIQKFMNKFIPYWDTVSFSIEMLYGKDLYIKFKLDHCKEDYSRRGELMYVKFSNVKKAITHEATAAEPENGFLHIWEDEQ